MIKFECQKCGDCCKNTLGWVYISRFEIENIARFMKITTFEFMQKYIIKDRGWYILSSPDHNQNCFLEDGECMIYPVRPKKCQDYPWWDSVLENRMTFLEESEKCRGLKLLISPKD